MAELSPRAKQVLKALIDLYIQEGQPVGSKRLALMPTLALSPATIRNVMADLELAGFIHSPHTSAGRVPTPQGYRLFVDCLLTVQPIDNTLIQQFHSNLSATPKLKDVMASVSNLLSGMTKMAGVVTLPKRNKIMLQQVEFLPLSGRQILVILVLKDNEIQNRIIAADRDYSRSELEQMGNYLTQQYGGMDLMQARLALLKSLQEDKQRLDLSMELVVNVAENAFVLPENKTNYVMAGQDHLQGLLNAFNEKRDMLQLFDHCIQANDIQIYIGEESGFKTLDACSLITAPYHIQEESVGIIGVIGPTRMAYESIIPLVDMTAKLLSMSLDKDKN
ncbi:MAG: heat-inducible transcriptional repressor HrcA [Gammaproteobacteria bacterium]|nr:heat-inducible transcriptional repressor HrcA [Gammaproteobacteria bacterium]